MKKLIFILLLLSGCDTLTDIRVPGPFIIDFKTHLTFGGNPMQIDICRYAASNPNYPQLRNNQIQFDDSCSFYNIGDTLK